MTPANRYLRIDDPTGHTTCSIPSGSVADSTSLSPYLNPYSNLDDLHDPCSTVYCSVAHTCIHHCTSLSPSLHISNLILQNPITHKDVATTVQILTKHNLSLIPDHETSSFTICGSAKIPNEKIQEILREGSYSYLDGIVLERGDPLTDVRISFFSSPRLIKPYKKYTPEPEPTLASRICNFLSGRGWR